MEEEAAKVRGRPRDPRVDQAVFTATEALLLERGYHGFGLQAVARRAGVGHSSIYRRWPSKAHLVHELLWPIGVDDDWPPKTMDVREFIRALVDGTIDTYSRPVVLAGSPGLLADFHADPGLQAALQERIDSGFRKRVHEAVATMADAGLVRPNLSADALLSAIAGSVLYALYVMPGATPLGREFAHELTELLVQGALPDQT